MRRHPLSGVLALAGVLCLLLLAEFWFGERRLSAIEAPETTATPVSVRAGTQAEETAAVPEAIDGWLRTALARPLMSGTRAPVAAGGASPTVSLSGGLPRLAGTIADDTQTVAIFAHDDGGKPLVLAAGASLGAWRVTHIEPNSVTLEGPSGRQVLHPSFGKAPVTDTPGQPTMQPGLNFPGLAQPNFPGRMSNMPTNLPPNLPPG